MTMETTATRRAWRPTNTAVAVPALVVLPALVLGVAAWLRRTLGGVTGDAHGAGIEIVETGLLAAIAVARGLA